MACADYGQKKTCMILTRDILSYGGWTITRKSYRPVRMTEVETLVLPALEGCLPVQPENFIRSLSLIRWSFRQICPYI